MRQRAGSPVPRSFNVGMSADSVPGYHSIRAPSRCANCTSAL
ncbi:hypothetical protein AB0368_33785 [Actinoplanes sp. NPDC051475]